MTIGTGLNGQLVNKHDKNKDISVHLLKWHVGFTSKKFISGTAQWIKVLCFVCCTGLNYTL